MAKETTEPRLLDIAANQAERPAPAPTGTEALSRAMAAERDQALAAVRQMRARLEPIATDAALPAEFLGLADRALSDLAAAEARCLGQHPSLLSMNELAATLSAVERIAASLARDVAAIRDHANSPEAAQERVRTSLAAMHADLFEKKILDPYLRFDSELDEEEYRKRERERKEEIERLQKMGTPEALRKANELVGEQLKDAESHGAQGTPELADLWQRHKQTDRALSDLSKSPTAPEAELAVMTAKSLAEAGVHGPATVDGPTSQQLPSMAELQAVLGRTS